MVPIRVIVAAPEAGTAELWSGDERLAVTVRYEGRLHLRIDPRVDGQPWMIDTTALALALDGLARELGRN
jgi:hypothetical protein